MTKCHIDGCNNTTRYKVGKCKKHTGSGENNYRQKVKEFRLRYLATHPCVYCGESDPLVLRFIHIRGEKKTSSMARMVSIPNLIKEIEKCEVRCANCDQRASRLAA